MHSHSQSPLSNSPSLGRKTGPWVWPATEGSLGAGKMCECLCVPVLGPLASLHMFVCVDLCACVPMCACVFDYLHACLDVSVCTVALCMCWGPGTSKQAVLPHMGLLSSQGQH